MSPRLSTYLMTVLGMTALAGCRSPLNTARPSPWATTMGIFDPAMPWKNREGESDDLDHDHPGFKLLGPVAFKIRPTAGAGYDTTQVGQHLAAVADTQAEAVGAVEEPLELVPEAVVVEYGFLPSRRLRPGRRRRKNPPQATRPASLSSDADRVIRSFILMSMQSKPARSNAAAISTWPLTPCSRKIPTPGLAVLTYGAGLSIWNVDANDSPGSVRSCKHSNSSSAQAGLSRSACM